MLDLINSAIQVTITNKNPHKILFNLKVIEFDLLFDLYKKSIFDTTILTNITLAKQNANVILTKEKYKLHEELHKAKIDKIKERIFTILGEPLKELLIYGTNTMSETFITLVPNINFETKIICVLSLLLFLKITF